MSSRRPAATLAVVALVGLSAACSNGADPADAPPVTDAPVIIPARTTGDVCIDPPGDLAKGALDVDGTLTEPAGIDLLRAEAALDGGALELTFDTVGPIADAPTPTFFLFQGPPAQLTSFEVQIAMIGPDAWEVTLVTYLPGQGEVVVDNRVQTLDVPVTVEGTQLRVTLPAGVAPPVATLLWAFGSESGGGDVIDDCSSFVD